MASYEDEQKRLHELMEACMQSSEEESPVDNADEGEEHAVECQEYNTNSEQDTLDSEESALQPSFGPFLWDGITLLNGEDTVLLKM